MSGDTSANNSKKLYTPVQPAFQTQGGGLSRLEREDVLESQRQNRGVGVGWAQGEGLTGRTLSSGWDG